MRAVHRSHRPATAAVTSAAVLLLAALAAPGAHAFSSGPPDGFAGNPPGMMDCTACHGEFPVNSGNGSLSLVDLPASFVPGATYDITVRLSDPDQLRWGFELTVVGPDPAVAGGELVRTDMTDTQLSDNPGTQPDYLGQTSEGTYEGTPDGPVTWSFQWVAPDLPSVTFYLAGNAADGNHSTGGDYIYTTSAEIMQSATAAERDSWGRVKALYSE